MNIRLEVKDAQGWIANPDYTAQELSGRELQMPTGFVFRLPSLQVLDYKGKGQGSFTHPNSLVFEFRIPVGFVRGKHDSRLHPNFTEQTTHFVTTCVEYEIQVQTSPEIQSV